MRYVNGTSRNKTKPKRHIKKWIHIKYGRMADYGKRGMRRGVRIKEETINKTREGCHTDQ